MHFKEIFRRHITSLTPQKAIWKYKVGEPCSRGTIIYIDLGNGARVKNRLFVCHDRAPDRCSDCVPTQKKGEYLQASVALIVKPHWLMEMNR
jgi:hypothetical protein